MKIRQGFVSNSSSSSFICGVAEILDKKKFDDFIEKNGINLDGSDVFIATESTTNRYDFRSSGDRITVESFSTDVSIAKNKPSTMYFVVNISNDEGDGPFWREDWCDHDYDIDLDYFEADQQKLFMMFTKPESGLSMDSDSNRITFGAARNG